MHMRVSGARSQDAFSKSPPLCSCMYHSDLFMKTAPSQSECFDLCNSTSGAVGWVWDACDQLCWCKAHNGPMVAKTCRCFGQIATTPTGAAAAQNALTVSSQYNGPIVHYATSTFGEDHISNTAIVGLTSLAAYSASMIIHCSVHTGNSRFFKRTFPPAGIAVLPNSYVLLVCAPSLAVVHMKGSPDGINAGEMKAFKACVKAFLLDTDSRKNSTVKVNVVRVALDVRGVDILCWRLPVMNVYNYCYDCQAWDESDFQIDVGTPEGVIEYKRIFDRNSQV